MKAHHNPFAPDRVQRLLPFDPQLAHTSWEEVEARWHQLERRAAIIGHKGSGKTTFLRTFAKRLEPEQDVIRLFFRKGDRTLGDRELKQLQELQQGRQAVLFVDGEGHLSARERHRLRSFARLADGYLVARHHRSQLPTLLKLGSSPELASKLLARINLPERELVDEKLPGLLRKKRGNLREVWLSLYDDYARHPALPTTDSPASEQPVGPGL